MKTLIDVATELRALDNQLVHMRDNVFAQMAVVVEAAILNIRDIDQTLRVDAAGYVPAIGDAFTLIDRMGIVNVSAKASEVSDE